LNNVVLIGRLTRDPEMRFTQNGVPVTSFTLAVNRQYKKNEADFIDCQAWRKTAEVIANHLKKGNQCAVEGRIEVSNYEAQDGTKKKITRVVVDNVHFLGGKNKPADDEADADPYLGEEVF
jgi:single-strand DNA-binding protein